MNNTEVTEISQTDEEISEKDGSAGGNDKKNRHSGFSVFLNKFFHHIDRGGTLKGEIMSGLTVFFLSICVIFMNVQIISGSLGVNVAVETSPLGANNIANATSIATLYAGAVIVAFIGSLVIGLIARLPFVQVSTMGLGTSLIFLIGSESGFTYYNLLFVSFIASIIYAVLVSVPKVRETVFGALPSPVRKALPAAVGAVVAFAALQSSGIVGAEYLSIGGSGAALPIITSGAEGITSIAFAAAIVAIVFWTVLRALRLKHPVFWSFIGGTIVFVLIMLIKGGINTSSSDSFVNFGRLWVFIGSQASDTTPFGDTWFSYLGSGITNVFSDFGRVFTDGTTFAEGTDVASFVISGVLCYLFTGMYDAEATVRACSTDINAEADENFKADPNTQKGVRLALICNAGVNVIAPFFGACGVTVSKTSVAGTRDNGKSGMVSVVASIGFLAALFVWVFPVLFATSTYPVGSMNEFNYNSYGNGGFIYCFNALSFGVADAVMVCVGASMLRGLKDVEWSKLTESMPVIATVLGALLTTDIACGVAFGVVSYVIAKFCSFRDPALGLVKSVKSNMLGVIREIGVPTAALCVLLVVMLILK